MIDIEIKPLDSLPVVSPVLPRLLPIVTYSKTNYEEFLNNNMRKNTPCIIQKVSAEWEATKKWIDAADKINFEYLINQYGNLAVPVTDCQNILYDHQPTSEMALSEFLDAWRNDTDQTKLLYLRQWHLQKAEPTDKFYNVPKLFGSDWLNEYTHDKQLDEFKFVFMGPKGAWTPLQSDVYNSFDWSVNITGKRKWYILPPGEEEKLKVNKNVIMRFDPDNYPIGSITYYQLIQEKGDALFIPAGWYHQSINEEDTVSVHHNWVNGCNIVKVWQALAGLVDTVKHEIRELSDLEEFPAICQNMVKSLYGMDCQGFQDMIVHIGEKRLAQFEGGSNIAFNNFPLGRNHCLYDLKCLQEVMSLMVKHPTYIRKEYRVFEKFVALRGYLTHIFG